MSGTAYIWSHATGNADDVAISQSAKLNYPIFIVSADSMLLLRFPNHLTTSIRVMLSHLLAPAISASYRWTLELARTRTPADLATRFPSNVCFCSSFASQLRALILPLSTSHTRTCVLAVLPLWSLFVLPRRYQRVASSVGSSAARVGLRLVALLPSRLVIRGDDADRHAQAILPFLLSVPAIDAHNTTRTCRHRCTSVLGEHGVR
ncbi:hypothetical protein ACQKWADRAFT_270351 [Trichoderma austrokoningii]